MIKIENFDFLTGKWAVVNKRLKERLNNCSEWIESPAQMETKKILNGLGSMDELKSSFFEDEFVGLSIRLLNPKSNEWTIYWADTANPELLLKEQVTGKFKDGIGQFYGVETYNGKKVKLRFIWKKENLNSAQWEQAYYDEINNEWETNWIMIFTKTGI